MRSFEAEELAAELIHFLKESYPGILERNMRSKWWKMIISVWKTSQRADIVWCQEINWIMEKAARLLLDDFRNGRLGRDHPGISGKLIRKFIKHGELRSDTGKSVKSGIQKLEENL